MSVREIAMYIDGQPVQSQSQEWRDVVNPATQEVVARVPFCTADEVERAITSAKEAFKEWRKVPLGKRMRIMLKLQSLIRDNTAELAALITEEHGKTLPDAEGEVGRGLEVVEHACGIDYESRDGADKIQARRSHFFDDTRRRRFVGKLFERESLIIQDEIPELFQVRAILPDRFI